MQLAQFLDQMDFNRYEKEVILFLAGVDHAEAQKIYKGTKIPKGRIYSILESLKEKNILWLNFFLQPLSVPFGRETK